MDMNEFDDHAEQDVLCLISRMLMLGDFMYVDCVL